MHCHSTTLPGCYAKRPTYRPVAPLPRVRVTPKSENAKTGAILVTTTQRSSCPTTCPLIEACYAKVTPLAVSWYQLDGAKGEGMTWARMLRAVRALPAGAAWRHNQAGDLPHTQGRLDVLAVQSLARANTGRRGWTYTHHKLTPGNVAVLKAALRGGFTVNASTESEAEADRVMTEHGIPTVVVARSSEERRVWKTPGGRRVVRCPATYNGAVQCKNCGGAEGPLCQRPTRDFVVAFPAHAGRAAMADAVVS